MSDRSSIIAEAGVDTASPMMASAPSLPRRPTALPQLLSVMTKPWAPSFCAKSGLFSTVRIMPASRQMAATASASVSVIFASPRQVSARTAHEHPPSMAMRACSVSGRGRLISNTNCSIASRYVFYACPGTGPGHTVVLFEMPPNCTALQIYYFCFNHSTAPFYFLFSCLPSRCRRRACEPSRRCRKVRSRTIRGRRDASAAAAR